MDTTATLNPILSDIVHQFMRLPAGFVATKLFPPFSTALQSANYYMFTAADLAQAANIIVRAPGSSYQRIKRTLSSDSYACEDYGLEAPVPDEDRKKYAAYFDADMSAVNLIVDSLRVNLEQRVYALATSAAVPTAAVVVPWGNAASNPKVDVDAAREAIRAATGLLPNLLVISQPILNALSIHPKVADFFKYTVPGVNDEMRLAAYFQIDQIAVARNVIASNNEGQTFTPADIWGDVAIIAHVDPAQDLKRPNFGRIFYWNAFTSEVTTQTGGTGPGMIGGGGGPDLLQIFSYRDETVKSDIHRCEHYVDEKLTAPLAGFQLTSVV